MFDLKRVSWNAFSEGFLKECQSEGWTLEDMQKEVESNELTLLGVFADDRMIATILLRDEFRELVVVGAGGITVDNSTYKAVLPCLCKNAKDSNFNTLRAHAMDKLRARALQIAGWEPSEYVFKIKVA